MRGTWDLAAARRLRAVVRTWRPDVVHVHDSRAFAIALAALVRRRELPLVVTRRVAHVPRGLGITYGRRVARFIAGSRSVREALIRSGIPPDRVDVVHVGLPAPAVKRPRDWRAECRWPAHAVLCGVAGSGAATAEHLDAIASLLPPAARERARLLILGGTGSGSGACTIGGVAAFRAGYVDDMHAAIAGLDVLWHLGGGGGLGTAVIEAMALRVPPVAFAVGAIPEVVLDGRTGLLAQGADVRAFAEGAGRLIEDDGLRRRLGARGPARARDFDTRRMVEMTERVYRAALSAPVAP
jgi:hypothetical protein